MLITDLDLPEFDYFDPTLRGSRLHEVLKEPRERHWVARGPVGWLVLDREVTIELLRDAALAAPLRTLFELIGIRDERWLDRRVNEALESTTGDTHARLRRIVKLDGTSFKGTDSVKFVDASFSPYEARVVMHARACRSP